MASSEALKRAVAREAVKNVENGEIIGLGSGTTIRHFVEELTKRIESEDLEILVVPTSYDTSILASERGIQLTTLDEHPRLSKCFDGADKVDKNFNMIKGGGGCHTREKVIASASDTVCILVDHTKLVDRLTGRHPIPIEVLPFSFRFVAERLSKARGTLKLRDGGSSKMGPLIGDNGGFIGDVTFQEYDDLNYLDTLLNSTPGIMEHGLFLGMADLVYVSYESRVEVLRKKLI
nr:ribose 5-phosphate isomerase A [Candidatus Njordarchaeota archaeon]